MQPTVLWWIWNGALLLGSYLLGSLPFGYLAGRFLKGIDIREHGSGSTGATNVLRLLGKGPGSLVLLMDVGKGVLAIALTRWAYTGTDLMTLAPVDFTLSTGLPWIVICSGLAAIVGHSKSIWLGFQGGKSVAISLGILLAIAWPVGLATLAVFAAVLAVSRIVSLSSMAGAIAVSVFMVIAEQPLPYLLFAVAGGFYVILRHRTNIERLLAGTEPQLGQKQA
jgi:acyl phosphate:glycerol-3-phosphate acyltransferase